MVRRSLVPVWVGIFFLASLIFMGAQPWGPATPVPAPLPKTGQTVIYAPGDDGDLEMGVPWPSPRFTDNANGTVTDNLTGLIWTKDADCDGGRRTWYEAIDYCNAMAAGTCGLSDGSVAGDWRLPNVRELHSLIDFGHSLPCLPPGHPFVDVQYDGSDDWIWTSTTLALDEPSFNAAWGTNLAYGYLYALPKDALPKEGYRGIAWCVRGGQ